MSSIPKTALDPVRIRVARDLEARAGNYVLYWMIAARRTGSNAALDRAIEWARALQKPLLVFEPLRCGYPYASDRLHAFVLAGMQDNQRALAAAPVTYFPYVEPEAGHGQGLLERLAAKACVVITDEFPTFFLPRMVAAAAKRLACRMEVVDSCGLVPLRATPHPFGTAFAFRRWLQKNLLGHLQHGPIERPLVGLELPRLGRLPTLSRRWAPASPELLSGDDRALQALPIDHGVPRTATPGGSVAASRVLSRFVSACLAAYGEDRKHPDERATSGLSPYLHFGHVSAWTVFRAVTGAEGWSEDRLRARIDGRRGWYGLSASAEEFLDQLVTWRELGYGFAWHVPNHAEYESLPEWARTTLEAHADPRGPSPALERLRRAESDDGLWNAAQNELLREGRIHNYLRMLWGKKILEWAPDARRAAQWMVEWNDRHALDGRDPNSYSGIYWCLGRFDRPWGPRRQRFGTVRFMSSVQTAKKTKVKEYLARHAGPHPS